MRSAHLVLIIMGILAQAFGWAIAPRRLKGLLAGLAIGLGSCWFLWYLTDHRSLSVTGFWTLTPMATWVTVHMVLVPIVGVEALAWLLPRRRWWVRCGGLSLILMAYGWGLGEAYGPPVVTEVSLAFPDLPPAFEGYRIILVGDIHAGPYAGTRTLGRWARAAQSLHGDLLVAAGDFIAQFPGEVERTGLAFEQVSCPDGRLGILGNHDLYPSNRDNVADRLRRHGWTVLDDEDHVLERGGQRLVFLGARYFREEPEPPGIPWKGKPWPQGFRIGLCHSPAMWPWLRDEGARLTLAAHTHGGQVNLSPFYNPAEEITPYVYGRYNHGPDLLFVTRGLGLTALPLRFRCRPELVRVTLHRS